MPRSWASRTRKPRGPASYLRSCRYDDSALSRPANRVRVRGQLSSAPGRSSVGASILLTRLLVRELEGPARTGVPARRCTMPPLRRPGPVARGEPRPRCAARSGRRDDVGQHPPGPPPLQLVARRRAGDGVARPADAESSAAFGRWHRVWHVTCDVSDPQRSSEVRGNREWPRNPGSPPVDRPPGGYGPTGRAQAFPRPLDARRRRTMRTRACRNRARTTSRSTMTTGPDSGPRSWAFPRAQGRDRPPHYAGSRRHRSRSVKFRGVGVRVARRHRRDGKSIARLSCGSGRSSSIA